MSEEMDVSVSSPVGNRIYTVRGLSVMLDSDLADVYGVETKRINEAVRRNSKRFTSRYFFQLLQDEWDILRSQFATSKSDSDPRGGRRHLPYVFTEHGAIALAMVLNSERAIKASEIVIDAFIRLRRVLDISRTLERKIDEIAEKVDGHDRALAVVFHELHQLVAGEPEPEPEKPKGRIGFRTDEERGISGKKKKAAK